MKKLHMICHTHWDREWYKSFEEFQVRLVMVMDHVLDTLENNTEFGCFHFDGQTVILDDYLTIKPENRQRISRLITDKKLFVGPWYTQPDEFMVSGESLIRNLLIGSNIADDFGHCMNVGYLPDSFGQTSQMPQIMKSMGIDKLVVWRGVAKEELEKCFFNWEGLDGTSILSLYLPLGYGYNRYLPFEYKDAYEHVKNKSDEIKDKFFDDILLMSGSDHAALHPKMTELIDEINNMFKSDNEDMRIEISSIEKFFETLKGNEKLPKLKGELKNPKDMRVHPGDSSSRMDIKYKNRIEENKLQRQVEIIKTYEYLLCKENKNDYLFGGIYSNAILNEAWKNLLKNHSHDSICTCCTDNIHEDILMRFRKSEDISKALLRYNTKFLEENLCLEQMSGKPLVIYNTLPFKRKDLSQIKVYTQNGTFKLLDLDKNEIPYIKIQEKDFDLATISIDASMTGKRVWVKETTLLIKNDFLTASGYYTVEIAEGEVPATSPKCSLNICENGMENKYLKITIQNDGTFEVLNKVSNRVYRNQNVIEDLGDSGDEYNYAPAIDDMPIKSCECLKPKIELILNTNYQITYGINTVMTIPKSLDHFTDKRGDDIVELEVVSLVSLKGDEKMIHVSTTIKNASSNHRVRMLFDSSIESNVSYAEDHFGIIERNNTSTLLEGWREKGYNEKPLSIFTHQGFVDMNDGNHGLGIISNGLMEYEILNNKTIALTLLRSVVHLGKPNLTIRPGRVSGVEIDTPESAMIGEYTFDYAIYPHENNHIESGIAIETLKYKATPYSIQLMRKRKGSMPLIKSYFEIDNKNIILSTMKKAEKTDAVIIRIYNTGANEEECSIKFNYKFNRAFMSNSKEIKGKPLVLEGGILQIGNCTPNEFKTVYLEY